MQHQLNNRIHLNLKSNGHSLGLGRAQELLCPGYGCPGPGYWEAESVLQVTPSPRAWPGHLGYSWVPGDAEEPLALEGVWGLQEEQKVHEVSVGQAGPLARCGLCLRLWLSLLSS